MEGIERTTALITGASSGIGLEMARVFASHGHNLVLVARNEARLEALAAELRASKGVDVRIIPKDLSSSRAAKEIYDQLKQEAVRVDILVNNAGMIVYGNFHENDWENERKMIGVNLLTPTALTKLFVRDMVQRGRGRILNVGSNGSFIPSPLNGVYSATKAYVLSLTEAMAEELVGTGVTATALCPGATRTELQQRAGMADVWLLRVGVMEAAEVARIGYRAVMAGKRVAIPGLFTQLQIFFTRLLPRRTLILFAKAFLQRT